MGGRRIHFYVCCPIIYKASTSLIAIRVSRRRSTKDAPSVLKPERLTRTRFGLAYIFGGMVNKPFTFQSLVTKRSWGLKVSGAVAPSALDKTNEFLQTLPLRSPEN